MASEQQVRSLMDRAGLCAYGEDRGVYNVPVPAMLDRIGRIIDFSLHAGRTEAHSERAAALRLLRSARPLADPESPEGLQWMLDVRALLHAADADKAEANRLSEERPTDANEANVLPQHKDAMRWDDAPAWATHIVGWINEPQTCYWAEYHDGAFFNADQRSKRVISFGMADDHERGLPNWGWVVVAKRPGNAPPAAG